MFKNKTILALVCVILVAVTTVGCQKQTPEQEKQKETTSVEKQANKEVEAKKADKAETKKEEPADSKTEEEKTEK